jgi:hypothetical protein
MVKPIKIPHERMVSMSGLWQEVCFILHDISQTSSEELYEQKVIQSLEKLG